MFTLTNENILSFLKEHGYKADFEKKTNQITTTIDVDGMQFPVFIRVLSDGPVLQILAFIPCTIKKESLFDISRLLHFLNKEMDIPGFGIDELAGVVFYRITVPALDNKVNSLLFETYLKSLPPICKTFTPAIINVSQGTMSFEALLQKAKEEREKLKP